MSRTDRVLKALAKSAKPMTVREICAAAKIKKEEAKFVSSMLGRLAAEETYVLEATSDERPCAVTGRAAIRYKPTKECKSYVATFGKSAA